LRYLYPALVFVLVAVFALGFALGRSGDDASQKLIAKREAKVIDFPQMPAVDDEHHGKVYSLEEIRAEPDIFKMLLLANESIAAMNALQVQQFILEINEAELGSLENNIILIGLRRLTAIDPISTLKFIAGNPVLTNADYPGTVVTNWLYQDPQAALDYVQNIQDQQQQQLYTRILTGHKALKDAGLDGQLDYLLGDNAFHIRTRKQLEGLTPEEAFEQALGLREGRYRTQQVQNALYRLAHEDAVAAFHKVTSLNDTALKERLLPEVFRALVPRDFELALSYVEDNIANNSKLKELLWHLARENPQRAMYLIEQYGDQHAKMNLVRSLAEKNPQQAIAYLDENNQSDQQSLKNYETVLSVYLRKDPDAALAWVVSRYDQYPMIAAQVLRQTYDVTSEQALLRAMENTNNRGVKANLLQSLVTKKLAAGSEQALQWLGQFDGQPGYNNALRMIARDLSVKQPARAAELLEPLLLAPASAPTSAPWVGSIASNWYKQDPEAALAWMDAMPPSKARDYGLQTLAFELRNSKPEMAKQLALKIDTGYMRSQATQNLAMKFATDPNRSAESLIEEFQLTGENAEMLKDYKQGLMSTNF
jgi:hypothetical protein